MDLVLQGHDHAYGRTHKVCDGRLVDPQSPGTVYAVSVSGTKMYAVSSRWASLMARLHEGAQLYQVVSVAGDRLSYESREADGTAVDAFELIKTAGAASRYVNRAPTSYRGWFGSLIATILRASLCSASGRKRTRPLSNVTPC